MLLNEKYPDNGLHFCIVLPVTGATEISETETTSFISTERTWIQISGWTGPDAVLYWSFDSSDGLVLMEGTEATEIKPVPLVSGKVN